MQLSEIAIRLYSNVSSDRGVFDVCNHQKMPPIWPIHVHWNIIGILPDVNRIFDQRMQYANLMFMHDFLCVKWWLYQIGSSSTRIPTFIFQKPFLKFITDSNGHSHDYLNCCFFLNFRHVLPTLHLFWRKNFQKLVFWLNYVQNPSCYMIYSYRVEKRKQAKSLLICCYTDLLTLSHQLVGLNDLWFLTNLIAVAILICSSLFC